MYNREIFDNFQLKLLTQFSDDINDVNFTSDIVKLPDTIANGIVYKLGYDGNLAEDGYEKGFLILTKGSGIKKHRHLNDIEKYVLLSGILSVDGKQSSSNICLLGNEHNIDTVTETTIIKTLKISKDMIYDKLENHNVFAKIRK